MKLGFMSAILPDLALREVVDFAAAEGFDCVELMCWPTGGAERRYAGVTHVDVTELSDERAAEIREMVEAAGVEISGLGYYPNPLSPDRDEAATAIAHIERVIEAAPRLGVSQVNSFAGRNPKQTVDENWPRFLAVWRPLVRKAEELGVQIGIENCPMLFSADEWPGGKNLATTPAIWRRMFEDIPNPNFGLNFDPSHFVWQQIDPIAPLAEFADRIFHTHAKDARVDRDRLNQVGVLAAPLLYHTPKLPGLGEVDWGRLISVLGDVGYRGAVCIEVEDRTYEGPLSTRQAALRQSGTYLRNFIASK